MIRVVIDSKDYSLIHIDMEMNTEVVLSYLYLYVRSRMFNILGAMNHFANDTDVFSRKEHARIQKQKCKRSASRRFADLAVLLIMNKFFEVRLIVVKNLK